MALSGLDSVSIFSIASAQDYFFLRTKHVHIFLNFFEVRNDFCIWTSLESVSRVQFTL